MIYLDTHVVAWLYAYGGKGVPEKVSQRIEAEFDLRISPMVRLELQYLYEIGRTHAPPMPVLDALHTMIGLKICPASFPAIVLGAERQHWTRDPFDRIIVAQAAMNEATLVTKDGTIRRHYPRAVWDED